MVELIFKKQQASPNDFEVITRIDTDGESENKNTVKWARLAMRYAKQIGDSVMIDAVDHIEDTGARIYFLEADYIDEMDDWDEDDFDTFEDDSGCCFIGELSDEEIEMAIGFRLDVSSAYELIGGLATPSVVLAQMVYQALVKKREVVKA